MLIIVFKRCSLVHKLAVAPPVDNAVLTDLISDNNF